MMELQIAELERATQLVQLPHLSQAERQSATDTVMEFRRAARPYDLCRRLLAASANPLLMFEAASTMRHALLREWRDLPADAVEQLRVSLLHLLGERRHELPVFVREQVLLAVCTMAKLCDTPSRMVDEMEQLLTQPNSDRAAQLLGCAGLRALLNEYQLGRCGLAWEEHVKRRRQFEEAGLLRAFVLCVRCAAASATSSEFVASNADLLLPLLQAMECALSWDFLPKRLPRRLAGLQSGPAGILRPNDNWRTVLLDSGLLPALFDLLTNLRQHLQQQQQQQEQQQQLNISHELVRLCLACISQLASLSGPGVFANHTAKEAHFTSLASLYSAALQQGLPAAGGPELTGFANVFANLCQHSGGCCSSLDRLPAALASQAAELTVRALEAAASASSASGAADASAGVSEAADSLLDAWAHLFAADSSGGPFDSGSAADLASAASSTEASAASTVGPIAQTLFAALMRSRLAPPDGFRGLAAMQQRQAIEADDDESVHELEETDQVRFASALAAAGEFARRAPAFALSALAEALDRRAELLAGVQQPAASAAAVWSASEDAHWLLLVVGHVIVEPDAEEAAPFVPRSLMSESLAQSANVAESVRALCEACQGQGRAGGGHSQQVDRLLQLVAAVMRMACLLARTAPEPSPLVLTDIAWLLSRLSRVYFGLDETLYDTISPAILAAFGQDSGESLRCCAQFAVDYCRVCLARWPGEPELANEAAKLMCALTERRDCIKYCGSSGTRVRRTSKLNFLSSLVASLPSWWQLAQDIGALTPPLTQAPPAALSTAVRAVVQAGRALSTAADQPAKNGRHSDAVERERTYWGVTVGRLQLRAGELISSGLPDSSTEAALALALDALAGCRDAAIAESSLLPLAEAAANLPALAANAAPMLLGPLVRLTAACVTAAAAPASVQTSRRLQAVANQLCRIVGQRTPPADASELGQLVGLLHSMLSQSLLDFWSEPEEHLLGGGETASTGAETAAAAVSGFADLLPAVARRLADDPAELAEPTLRLCVAAAEAASDRLLAMPEEALNSLAMGCLRPALAGELPSDSRRFACECVSALALSGWPLSGRHAGPLLAALLCPQSNSAPADPAAAAASLDGLDSGGSLVSDAVLALCLADPAAFAALADAWLISDGGGSTDERRRERLGDALNQLATGVAEAAAASSRTAPSGSVNGAGAQSRRFPDRPARLAFAEQFEMFLVRLRAIAIV
ncbi:hypothetical protein BOX15_Mlig008392g1 [Macrostomum lignano]|uniref:Exportin-4 n=2 Tax=Macrostomum lignano TaxID=282301 RepID=A0A267GQ42_9PLAT|nr:hypothetical protein BOX15_Mlig008392g1 [Macrostomum lignano]